MKVGWIGLGKLGLPCALAMAHRGHEVVGTDANPLVEGYLRSHTIPYQEAYVDKMWAKGAEIGWRASIAHVMRDSDIVFVAVQTPHAPGYEGITPTPDTTRDFEYGYLEEAVKEVARWALRDVTLVIVSTVLPGTTHRVILPRTERQPNIHLVYSPAFIAMGTAALDWLSPAIVLAGTTSEKAYGALVEAHSHGIAKGPTVIRMSIQSAELTKVLYNTFIGMKIVFANTAMELSHKTGADCDEITGALALATDRIISPAYLRGGMGDGGGCHPRDNIALSHLAKSLDLSVNPFDWLMRARDKQTQWLADLARGWSQVANLPILICGQSYKKNSTLTVGSPSRLLESLLLEMGGTVNETLWQETPPPAGQKAIYIIGCNHDAYTHWQWPEGSVILDAWGYIQDQPGVVVVRIGRK